jgi:hypothetical protein
LAMAWILTGIRQPQVGLERAVARDLPLCLLETPPAQSRAGRIG